MVAAESVQPFATAGEYLDAELEHYKLQLKRLFAAAGYALGEWPPDTHVSDGEIKEAYQPAESSGREEVAASRARVDARLVASLGAGLFIPIAALVQAFALDDLDWEILIALLAPAASLELERLTRAAWRDFTVHYPSAGFLAKLLRPDSGPEAILDRLAHDAPLRRHMLVREMSKVPTAPTHEVFQIDPDVAAYLHLGRPRLARALANVSRIDQPAPIPLDQVASPAAPVKDTLLSIAGQERARIILAGPAGAGKRTLARAVAAELGVRLLELDLHGFIGDAAQVAELLPLALRDARISGAALYLDGRLQWDDSPVAARVEQIAGQIEHHPNLVFFASRLPSPRLRQGVVGAMEVAVEALHPDAQPHFWTQELGAHGFGSPSTEDLRGWVCQAGLTPGLIQRAVAEAVARARLHRPAAREVHLDELRDALRTRVANGIAGVASRVATVHTWDDVILPEDTREQLEEVLNYARHQDFVLKTWGFDAKLPYGRSLSVLFTGPPGTGKTMVAGVIARSLGRDLYRVDLANIVSKYIGETEKNLARVFDEAESSQAVILFDEADSLFGKRTEVRNSVDRYSNLEVNYLLQRIEDYPGIAILTTNFPKSIDDAFRRRLRFIIDFPQPDFAMRKLLWRSMIPATAEVAPELPFDELAKRFDMSPGHIKNAVLKAAFNAAAFGRPLDGPALLRAAYFVCVGAGKLVHSFEPPRPDGTMPAGSFVDEPDAEADEAAGPSPAEQLEAARLIRAGHELADRHAPAVPADTPGPAPADDAGAEPPSSERAARSRRMLPDFPFPPRGKIR